MMWFNLAQAQSFMPTEGTKIATQVDNLYGFLLVASLISFLILMGGMTFFVFKYKRRTNKDKTGYITHNTFLEFLWSFIPLVIFLGVFAWGWLIYHEMRSMPKDALEVHVFGKQWAWEFEYKSGVKAGNLLVVPVNKDVKLIMTSKDVIHSFYIPSFRIKQDVIPGRYTALWFNADKLGEYHVFCAEFCGTQHSGMLATLKVVPQAEYEAWLEDESQVGSLPLAKRGEKLFAVKACASCHSVADAATKVGPTLWKKFGTKESIEGMVDVDVDENYLRESILNPNAKIVKGFPKGVMPAFQGQLNETELNALIEYVKTLK
ncbi:MAG TPA: cytochrome c oxidase subunit II [Pseudobdellovibrionaceae bacterium]|jgi:cytochrome c oxidase subunit 2